MTQVLRRCCQHESVSGGMSPFSRLYQSLDETRATRAKVRLLTAYLRDVDPRDGAWAVFFLSGRRLKRLVSPTELRQALLQLTGMPDWLLEETYASVGDLAETLALLVETDTDRPAPSAPQPLHVWVEQRLLPLRQFSAPTRIEQMTHWWLELPVSERFLLNKLLTGGLRVGVSRRLLIQALSAASGVDPAVIAHRLMGQWQPDAAFFSGLFAVETRDEDRSRPYPFYLASPLTSEPQRLGAASDWLVEWKWDGIRAQLSRRSGQCAIWSRGEELLDGRFPELESAAMELPDALVLDGEVLAWRDAAPLPFQRLQRRIQRLRPDAKLLRDAPVIFLAYDLLEMDGLDLRHQPLRYRRACLQQLLANRDDPLGVSPALPVDGWAAVADARDQARDRGAEGVMLKRWDSVYRVGRVRGDWWKWKLAPLTIDAVLLYAQPGHGRRSSLYTDYTFGIWRDAALVPIAKAYSGLTQEEIETLDRWIRANTVERYGPVRAVRAAQVFELAFDGIAESPRHKSGLALRFPRIQRWRLDLDVEQADTVEHARELLA